MITTSINKSQILTTPPLIAFNASSPVQHFGPSPSPAGFTPMILTTNPTDGTQSLSTLALPMIPVMQIDCNGNLFPSPSPLSYNGNVFPSASPASSYQVFPPTLPLVIPPISRSPSPAPPMGCMMPKDQELYMSGRVLINEGTSSISSFDESSSGGLPPYSSLSSSIERERVHHVEPYNSERPKEPIYNVNNLAVPVFTENMTKKDIVNDTLKWMFEVFGSEHFDVDGRRGPNVLRLKVKTRGALEHICPLLNEFLKEGLISHVSCPISTKKSRQHIRGYLSYIECVSDNAVERVMQIFNKYNEILITDCDGKLEHPFKGLSRNPKKQLQKLK